MWLHITQKRLKKSQGSWQQNLWSCRYEDAVGHFTKCIGLDKGNEIYYSNRAAALTALKRYAEALEDAKSVVRLKPNWAKGWARAGAAHFGLEEWAEVLALLLSPWKISCKS
jgi:tetratricopeptide (TPR) repeat protein